MRRNLERIFQEEEAQGLMRRDARAVEGARLEIVCSDKIGTEGSNPSLSAIASLEVMHNPTLCLEEAVRQW